MNLELVTNNEYLKTIYSEKAKNHVSDSGFDLYVPKEVIVPANAISFILNLEVKCRMIRRVTHPYMIFPRSSMGAKTPLRLANSIGLIDKDYRGDIMLILDNLSSEPFVVEKGSRLAQIVSFSGESFGLEMVTELNDTERGTGGLGSTGT